MFSEVLDDETIRIMKAGKVWADQRAKERAAVLRDEAGWDAKEARKIWDVYEDCILVDGTKGVQRLDRIKSYVIAAFRDWVSEGPLAKEPVQALKVTFTDATVHEDPAHTGYNEIAGMTFSGLSLSFLSSKPKIYEPIQKVDIKTPLGTEGNIISILSAHRGQILGMDQEDAFMRVKGKLPASETIGIADEFRSATQGKAFFGYEFFGFEPVPSTEEMVTEIRKRKGMPEVKIAELTQSWERFIYARK
jgi:elongation factor 2